MTRVEYPPQKNRSIETLFGKIGINSQNIEHLETITGGNNKIDVLSDGKRKYAAKWYPEIQSGERDQLLAEWLFLDYANKVTPESVPKTFAYLPAERVALYEFIEGKKLTAASFDTYHITRAGMFLRELNERPYLQGANNLPRASEGFLSVSEHLKHVHDRCGTLMKQTLFESAKFATTIEKMCVFLDRLDKWVTDFSDQFLVNCEARLDTNLRIISPSDFGFHNVLQKENGQLVFIDFEHAGWDDPAKTINDFFLQPSVRVPFKYFETFTSQFISNQDFSDSILTRTNLLRPILALKWCCIILNPFISDWVKQRAPLFGKEYLAELKTCRLQRADKYLNDLPAMIKNT